MASVYKGVRLSNLQWYLQWLQWFSGGCMRKQKRAHPVKSATCVVVRVYRTLCSGFRFQRSQGRGSSSLPIRTNNLRAFSKGAVPRSPLVFRRFRLKTSLRGLLFLRLAFFGAGLLFLQIAFRASAGASLTSCASAAF